MKKQIKELIGQSLEALKSKEIIPAIEQPRIMIENSRDTEHGDFATNIAMVLAKLTKTNPRELAKSVIEHLPESDILEKTEITGPGFINFFLKQNTHQSVVTDILDKGDQYGNSDIGNNIPTLIEFVSANPTGPLHIGHGRGAAYGAVVSSGDLAGLLRLKGHRPGFGRLGACHAEFDDLSDHSVQTELLTIFGPEDPRHAVGL